MMSDATIASGMRMSSNRLAFSSRVNSAIMRSLPASPITLSVHRATSRNFIESATFSMSSAEDPLASAAATIAPELTPETAQIGMLFFSNARRTPMCAMPRAKPPPSARPMRGPPRLLPRPLRIQSLVACHQPRSIPCLLNHVVCLIYVPRLLYRCISGSSLALGILSVSYLTSLEGQRELSGVAAAKLALHRLNVTGSVLMIAAHPDDENTALLAYLARGRKVRTGYLSLTRGDGGQNLIGPEQGDALGVIRTQELLAARRIDGAGQFFTHAIDFGFTNTPQ